MRKSHIALLVAGALVFLFAGLTESRAEDVLLVTSNRLETNEEFDRTVEEYIAVLEETEDLTAGYYVMEFQESDRYGYPIPDGGRMRDDLQDLIDRTGASYIIILGGDKVFPRLGEGRFYSYNSPRTGELITDTVWSDAWYIDFDGDDIIEPGLAIGRLPDVNFESDAVIAGLRTAIELHEAGGYRLYAKFLPGCPAPPFGDDPLCPWWGTQELCRLMSTSSYIFLGGHGWPTSLATNEHVGILTLRRGTLEDIDLETHHPVIVSILPCYTGNIWHTPGNSVAEGPTFASEFIARGAAAFVGRTTSNGIRNHIADNFRPALEEGERIGDALFRLMRESLLRDEGNWEFMSSALHLCLHGDPTLRRIMPTGIDPLAADPPSTELTVRSWVNGDDLRGPQPYQFGGIELRDDAGLDDVTTHYRYILDHEDEGAAVDSGWLEVDARDRFSLEEFLEPSLDGKEAVILAYSASGPDIREQIHFKYIGFDFTPPSVNLTIDGDWVATSREYRLTTEADSNPRIEISAGDEYSGLVQIAYRIGSSGWVRVCDVSSCVVDVGSDVPPTFCLTFQAEDSAGNIEERSLEIRRDFSGIIAPENVVLVQAPLSEPPKPLEEYPPSYQETLHLDLPIPPTIEDKKAPDQTYFSEIGQPAYEEVKTEYPKSDQANVNYNQGFAKVNPYSVSFKAEEKYYQIP